MSSLATHRFGRREEGRLAGDYAFELEQARLGWAEQEERAREAARCRWRETFEDCDGREREERGGGQALDVTNVRGSTRRGVERCNTGSQRGGRAAPASYSGLVWEPRRSHFGLARFPSVGGQARRRRRRGGQPTNALRPTRQPPQAPSFAAWTVHLGAQLPARSGGRTMRRPTAGPSRSPAVSAGRASSRSTLK